ncbi:MAG: alpha/beta hydrolase [Myxococcota bacterium]
MKPPPTHADAPIPAPPPRLLALEARVLAELPRFLLGTRRLDHLPRGDGHAVMVVPGWGVDDRPTLPLRLALGRLGYAAYGWGLGRNLGRRPGLHERLDARIAELGLVHGGPVSLIGWSLGGVVVREAARRQPHAVRRVFSLGSPINGDPDANNVTTMLRLLRPGRPGVDRAAFDARRVPPPVACVAVHTKTDGVVAWRCALEEPAAHTENVEVRGSHAGLIVNLEVLAALAERLPRARFEPGEAS